MDTPPKIGIPEELEKLKAEEIEEVLEFYTEEEKEELISPLKASNGALKEKLAELDNRIKEEQFMTELFLKKLWMTFSEEEKKEGAGYFKEIYDRIMNPDIHLINK